MDKDKIIAQLEDLKDHCEWLSGDDEPNSTSQYDVEALDYAIRELKKDPSGRQSFKVIEK